MHNTLCTKRTVFMFSDTKWETSVCIDQTLIIKPTFYCNKGDSDVDRLNAHQILIGGQLLKPNNKIIREPV